MIIVEIWKTNIVRLMDIIKEISVIVLRNIMEINVNSQRKIIILI